MIAKAFFLTGVAVFFFCSYLSPTLRSYLANQEPSPDSTESTRHVHKCLAVGPGIGGGRLGWIILLFIEKSQNGLRL